MEDYTNYDEQPTVIRIGGEGASSFVEVFGNYDGDVEYSNAKGRFMQKRAANVAKRQEAKREIRQEKQATKVERKVGRQDVKAQAQVAKQERKGAKQVAKQVRKTDRVAARDVKKQTRVGMRNTAKAGRMVGRQDKRNIRVENRMMRREMKNPVPVPSPSDYLEEPIDETPIPSNEAYTEDSYAPEGGEMGGNGYDSGYETNGEVEEVATENGGGYYEEDASGDANPMYNDEGYGYEEEEMYMPEYVSEDGGYSDEFDQEYAEANGASSFLVRPKRSRANVGIPTRVSPSARFSKNRIVVPAEKTSGFDSNESTRGMIAVDAKDDYDAPEETVINLEPKSGFDGLKKMSNTTKVLFGIGALVAIGIYVSTRKK
jgi:hypothetical protein